MYDYDYIYILSSYLCFWIYQVSILFTLRILQSKNVLNINDKEIQLHE